MAIIKSFVTVEVEKNDKTFLFLMPVGAPLGEAYDAAFEVLQELVARSKEAADSVKQQDPNA